MIKFLEIITFLFVAWLVLLTSRYLYSDVQLGSELEQTRQVCGQLYKVDPAKCSLVWEWIPPEGAEVQK